MINNTIGAGECEAAQRKIVKCKKKQNLKCKIVKCNIVKFEGAQYKKCEADQKSII